MRRLADIRQHLESSLAALCAVLLAILLMLVLTAVVLRYFFATALIGADELAIWLHVALIGLGAPLMVSGPLGMRMDILVERLPPKGQAGALILADSFTLLAALILAVGGAGIAQNLGGLSPSLGVPEWVRFALPAVGGGLTAVVLVLHRIEEKQLLQLTAALGLTALLYYGCLTGTVTTDLSPSLIAGIIALVGMLTAAPIAHVMLACAFLALPFGASMPEPAIAASTVAGMSKFLLLAIPFFLLAGGIFALSDLARTLIRFAGTLVGHWRGGLAQTTLLTSVLFSGASGSSIANAAFMATSMSPALIARGYAPTQAGAIIASTAVLDNIIPPSIAFLILAAATNLSVGKLLTGGFVAGAILTLALTLAIRFTAREAPGPRASAADRWRAAWGAAPALGLGVVVVAGIRLGLVTTTEAAALAAGYTILAGLRSKVGIAGLRTAFVDAGANAAAIGLLIGAASPLAFLIAVDDIAALTTKAVEALGAGPIGTMLLANLILLAAGLALDTGVSILLLAPILVPIVAAAGIDPIHFGVILVVNLMIGGLTPPVGILVYVVGGVMRLPITAIFRAVMPFLAALLVALAVLCAAALLPVI